MTQGWEIIGSIYIPIKQFLYYTGSTWTALTKTSYGKIKVTSADSLDYGNTKLDSTLSIINGKLSVAQSKNYDIEEAYNIDNYTLDSNGFIISGVLNLKNNYLFVKWS